MEKAPRMSMYPERPSEGIAPKVENLKKIISGEIPVWEISEKERGETLAMEATLAKKLESIHNITPRQVSLNLDYLYTEVGRDDFSKTVGVELPVSVSTYSDLKKFLYEQTEQLALSDPKKLSECAGRSRTYRKEMIANKLKETMNEDGTISVDVIPQNDTVTIRLTPDLDRTITTELRSFKEELKQRKKQLAESTARDEYKAILGGILELYHRKVNAKIADSATVFVIMQKKEELLGEEFLSPSEKSLLEEDRVSRNIDSNLARYDKFLKGTDINYDEHGWRRQISSELLTLAEVQEQEYENAVLNKEKNVAEKGLDSKKLFAKEIGPEQVEQLCKETLAHYGLLSEFPASVYSPDRPGAAPDNKWQVIVSESYQSHSVDDKQKVLRCPVKKQSIGHLLSVTIAHEIEGHILQNENRSLIPLQLFKNIGGDRSSIFAEAGAMHNQDYVSKEAFGFNDPPKPHYIKAMAARLEGANYAECLNVYYESIIKPYRKQREQNQISPEAFKKKCVQQLKIAISSAGRLFQSGVSKEEASFHLSNSKDSVYAEQTKLVHELESLGLEELIYLTNVNLSSLEFLLRAQFMNTKDIKTPDFYSLQIWEREKQKYTA
jgi:hypothetical protein